MEVDSGQIIDDNSPTAISKVTINQEASQPIAPQEIVVSPLGTSRYGRTRKPKISEDFFDIDMILEVTREPKRSPRSTVQIKSPFNKKPLQTKSPRKPNENLHKAVQTKLTSKPKRFVHVTGDTVISRNTSLSSSDSEVQSSPINAKTPRKFFKKECDEAGVKAEAEISAGVEENVDDNKQIDGLINSSIDLLNEGSLNVQAIDVTEVLKIIANKSPGMSQESSELKAEFKPVLKTYGNKRRSVKKMVIVESFGLPDKPIFPIKSEKSATSNEPKRIKKLDVAEPTSENDINIIDKKLLNTPWKIAGIGTDFNKITNLLVDSDLQYPDNIADTSESIQNTSQVVYRELRPTHKIYANDHCKLNKTKNVSKGSPNIQKRVTLENTSDDIYENIPQNEVIALNEAVLNEYKHDPRVEFLDDIEISPENCDVKAAKPKASNTRTLLKYKNAIYQECTPISNSLSVELKNLENKMNRARLLRGRANKKFEIYNEKYSTLEASQVKSDEEDKSAEPKIVSSKSIAEQKLEEKVNVLEKYEDSISGENKTQTNQTPTEKSLTKQKFSVLELPTGGRKLGLRNTLSPKKGSKAFAEKQKLSLSPKKIIEVQRTEKLTVLRNVSSQVVPQRKSERLKMGNLTNLYKNSNTALSKTGESLQEINLLEKIPKIESKVELSDQVDEVDSDEINLLKINPKSDLNIDQFKEIDNYCLTEKLHKINLPETKNLQLPSPRAANTTMEYKKRRSTICGSTTSTSKSSGTLIFSDVETSELADIKSETELEAQNKAKTIPGVLKQNFEEISDVKPVLHKSFNPQIKMEPEDIQLGDLMWARIGQYPYWPCVVTKDPISSEYSKNAVFRKSLQPFHHVKFFGDRGRRAWVLSSSLVRFINTNDLQTLFEQTKNKIYFVKRKVAKWEAAVAEAVSLTSSSVQERFDFFFNMFASELNNQRASLETNLPTVRKRCKTPKPIKSEYFGRKRSNSDSCVKLRRSKSLQALQLADGEDDAFLVKKENIDLNCIENDVENIPSTSQITTNENGKIPKSPKKAISKLNTKNQLETSIQKRALKIKEKREKNENMEGEPEVFSPWQTFDMQNIRISTPINEVNSEYSLSDTDSASKSSMNTPQPDIYKVHMARHKKNNIFRGISRDKVCQVCKKPGDILKCKGPCSGTFHYGCANGESNKKKSVKKERNNRSSLSGVPKKRTLIKGKPENSLCDEMPDTTTLEKNKDGASKNETGINTKDCEMDLGNEISINNGRKEINEGSLTFHITKPKENIEEDLDRPIEGKVSEEEMTTSSVCAIETASTSNTVDVIYIDCDESNFEQRLTPKARLTPCVDFSKYSLVEQIDMKLEEVMQELGKTTRYADSTTDYTSSEESLSNLLPSVEQPQVSQKKNRIDHVTADHISASSNTSLDRIGEDASTNIRQEILKDDFKCSYCILNIEPPCFVCHKEVSSKDDSFRQKCSLHQCGKFYHFDCIKTWPQTQWSLISTAKHKNSDRRFDTFVCPVHVCHTCASDNPHAAIARCASVKVVKCLRCPATYHNSNYCVPAGTVILSSSQIVCPRHLSKKMVGKNKHSKYTSTVNTAWCFICSEGGHLICCETCPTSVHTDCVEINLMEDGTFICEDCETGRFPLYDEIVWVKLGNYRWWPALILFPNEIPENIKKLPNIKGEFVVKFYGTHDHYWVNRGRVFSFQEGDIGHSSPSRKRVDALFKKSLVEAAAAHRFRKVFEKSKEAELRTGMKMKPPPYIRVKVNKPVGNVRLFDGNVSNTTPCDCNPNQDNPCGPDSDCLNRLLWTECVSNVCPANANCNNQRFEKRQYPLMEPFKTPGRGWGLKSLAPIRKGDFVIEYVGEVIDDQEYQRRIRKMHEQKDENYYFLTIDKDRIIDAGPKGNLARFMNHCCQPNCETQKWTVNGDTRVGLFAVEDILEDTELTFNYNLECIGKGKKVCRCGAPNCSGFIGVKAKMDESQKKPKKSSSFKKRKPSLPPLPVSKNDSPCFVCGEYGDVGACQNKMCSKFYHMKCVNLECWPEGKWVCPWHNCNICSKRTIRCCVKCINSYCPVHSEGNVRYNKLQGFICSEHDPARQPQAPSDENVMILRNPITSSTEETDVTSTTPDEINHHPPNEIANGIDDGTDTAASADLNFTKSVTSTPIQRRNLHNFVHNLKQFETTNYTLLNIPEELIDGADSVQSSRKRKRGRPPKRAESLPKRIKLSNSSSTEAVTKPTSSFMTGNHLDIAVQNEVKLSSSIPTRHLRTTRNNAGSCAELQRFLNRQNELEKDLPMRKRSRPRCEASL